VTGGPQRDLWRKWAADLTAELGVEVLWCPLGFEIPDGKGGIDHVDSPDMVRRAFDPSYRPPPGTGWGFLP
jgi:hypothetical protein